MKVYAIRDKEIRRETPIGYLFCYEKAKEGIIELNEDLDEWEAPLLFQKCVREKKYTIPKELVKMWVEERVIPSGRQNIGRILKNAKMNEYNEMMLLAFTKGKCSQDSCYLEEISKEALPENIKRRREKNVTECCASENGNIICFFGDALVRKVSLKKLALEFKEVTHVLGRERLFYTIKVGIGGYSVSFDNAIEIPVEVLRNTRFEVPLDANDFKCLVENNIVNTSKACDLMQCSKQNVSYLVNSGRLEPLINNGKEKWFTRGDIERLMTE